jgi:hypothetical protein
VSLSPYVSSSASSSGTGPAPIPAATLQAVIGGRQASITAVKSPGSVLAHPAQSQVAALRAALAQQPHGSQVLGLTLARVRGFGSGLSQATLVWLVSVDPFGGSYVAGNPACGRLSFVVEFIEPDTSRWLMTSSGRQAGLPPIPPLGPTPSPVAPNASCGDAAPPVHQGTPAAN